MFDSFVSSSAARFPDRLAFEQGSRRLTFRELESAVQAVEGALAPLRGMKLRLVAVSCADMFHHWLLLLGLARLGVASASLPPALEDVEGGAVGILAPELVIEFVGEGEIPSGSSKVSPDVERLELSESWFHRVLDVSRTAAQPSDAAQQEAAPLSPEALCRVALASGTRADPQPMGLTGAGVQTAMLRLLWLDAMTGRSTAGAAMGVWPTLISTIHPSSLTGFLAVCSALGAAASVRFPDPRNAALAFAGQGPLVAILSPGHLGLILEALSPQQMPRADLHLVIGGGLVSARLLERCQERLTSNVRLIYATDETGPVAEIAAQARGEGKKGEENMGPLLPWVQAQVVREDGALAAMEEEGEIRLRVPGSITAYLPRLGTGSTGWNAASAQRFRQGWFYPGDRGYLTRTPQQGLELHFCGRVDELVSLGGEKIDLAFLDRELGQVAGLTEVACFVYTDANGLARLGCAAVRAPNREGTTVELQALAARVQALYPGLPTMPVFWLNAVPHDELGAPDRNALAQGARGRIPQAAGGQAGEES